MDKLRAILNDLGFKFKFEIAVADKLEDHEGRVYALEENRKLKDQAITSLEKRYSELLMTFKSVMSENRKLRDQVDQLFDRVRALEDDTKR